MPTKPSEKKTQKILLYGAPSSGKSMTAALVFAHLKLHFENSELVREVAKDLVYEGLDLKHRTDALQLRIFADQMTREELVDGRVDYLVSDSPLLLNAYYSGSEDLKKLAKKHLRGKELHFWLGKDPSHHENAGRVHSLQESKKIDQEMKTYLEECGIKLIEVTEPIETRGQWITQYVLKKLDIA